MTYNFDQDILDAIAADDLAAKEEIANRVLADTQDWLKQSQAIAKDTESSVERLFKASDYASSTPFAPPSNVPVLETEEHSELMQTVNGQSLAWEVAIGNAKNAEKAAVVEQSYANAALTQAKTQVIYQKIANEGLNLQQAIRAGELIQTKTEGIEIAIAHEQAKNLGARELAELESQRTAALIHAGKTDIGIIYERTNQKLIKAQGSLGQLQPSKPF